MTEAIETIEAISATLNVREKQFKYNDCNAYQKVIYRSLDKQIKLIKEKENKYRKENTPSNYNDVQRAVGVLEFFVAKLESYAGVTEVPHIFKEGR